METKIEPMIKLEEKPDPRKGGVPVLSYNVPEPTSYTGQNFLELDFIQQGEKASDHFKPECFKSSNQANNEEFAKLQKTEIPRLKDEIITKFKTGIGNSTLANANLNIGMLRMIEKPNPGLMVESNLAISKQLQKIDPEEVALQVKNGFKLNIYKNLYGKLTYNYIPASISTLRPRIVLIETYRLSSFLGSYGAGRTIKTFSLLPGEKTKISIKTYHKTESTSKDASSILDSFTEESADDFENSVSSENSSQQNQSESFEYHAEAEASASWGWGSAKVSGGVKGGTNSSREEFAKNTQNAVSKHSNKASAKRDVQINTSTEVKESSGEETETVREIENINVSRTLNFVFRQMNQEFISILHLIDIRLAFFNGESLSRREYTLPELDDLIDKYFVPAKQQEVKKAILNQILHIKDFRDNQPNGFDEDGNATNKTFIQKKKYIDNDNNPVGEYYQFSKDQYSKYTDQTGREILVEGIILSTKKNVLRTDGVIVDAILGQGVALDSYSQGLQDEAIKEKHLLNSLKEKEIAKQELAETIISNGDLEKAKLYEQVYQCCLLKGEKEKNENHG